ncbi:hypothetical protein GCM10027203_80840 [Nonomuraea fastidiosa]
MGAWAQWGAFASWWVAWVRREGLCALAGSPVGDSVRWWALPGDKAHVRRRKGALLGGRVGNHVTRGGAEPEGKTLRSRMEGLASDVVFEDGGSGVRHSVRGWRVRRQTWCSRTEESRQT